MALLVDDRGLGLALKEY